MGSTAKLMLVGILVLVIVIALVWEKQGSEVRQMSVESAAMQRAAETRSGGSVSNENPQAVGPRVGGSLVGKQGEAAEQGNDFESEFVRVAQKQRSAVLGPQPETEQMPTQQQPAATQNAVRKHKVAEGESLWVIAKRYYKDGTKSDLIMEANKDKLQHGSLMRPGTELVIPYLKEEVPGTQLAAQSSPASVHQPEVAPDGKVYYTVQEGDILGTISQKVYGTSKRWREILEANKSILSDEKSLRPGMKLCIPDAKKN
jgi:nucleoid-associated protein YgaU